MHFLCRVFLQNHGYRLTNDHTYVIVQDDLDTDSDSASDNTDTRKPVQQDGELEDNITEPVSFQAADEKFSLVSSECWD